MQNNATGEYGPAYGVPLIDVLPLNGNMMQKMPSREDLEQVRLVNERVVAGYEILLWHYLLQIQKESP